MAAKPVDGTPPISLPDASVIAVLKSPFASRSTLYARPQSGVSFVGPS